MRTETKFRMESDRNGSPYLDARVVIMPNSADILIDNGSGKLVSIYVEYTEGVVTVYAWKPGSDKPDATVTLIEVKSE